MNRDGRKATLVYGFFFMCVALASGCAIGHGSGDGGSLAAGTGIGGTGVQASVASGTGIGGTGHSADTKHGSGIGGTGVFAAARGETVGIRGRITAFGSILVNGVKVELTAATVVRRDDGLSSHGALALGQVVELVSVSDGIVLSAEDVRIRYEVIGPVDASGKQAGAIRVLGQTVLFSGDTVFSGEKERLLATGARVKVSGVRDGQGRVLASRLEAAAPVEPDSLTGQVESSSPGGLLVSGLPVRMAGPQGQEPETGDIVTIRGSLGAGGFVATGWQGDRFLPFDGRAAVVIIEAVPLSRGSDPAGRRLAGMSYIVDDRENLLANAPDGPLRIIGKVGAGGVLRPVRIHVPSSLTAPMSLPRYDGAPGQPSWRQQAPMSRTMPITRGPRR